jgi:hypothetical protein
MLKGSVGGVCLALILGACSGERASFPSNPGADDDEVQTGDAGSDDEGSSKDDGDSSKGDGGSQSTSETDDTTEPDESDETSQPGDADDSEGSEDERDEDTDSEPGPLDDEPTDANDDPTEEPTDDTTEPSRDEDTTEPPVCGDGELQGSEDCDDGNMDADDGCDECEVAEGWVCEDEPSDCDDIDECEEDMHDCDEHAICTNNDGSFECDCEAGYSGNGNTCSNVDECSDGTTSCDAHASCQDADGDFACVCNPGYTGSGETCTDVDECTLGTDNCGAHSTCSNEPAGKFTCECNAGYSGDGIDCVDVDECATQADDCAANAKCTNTPGGFACGCNEGYTGDGQTCADVDECTPPGSHDCNVNATCDNAPAGSFTCACNEGYSGDGKTCTDIHECNLNQDDCHAYAQCDNTTGSFMCTCLNPYFGDGKQCGCRAKSTANVLGQGGFDTAASVTQQGSAIAWAGTYEYNVTWWDDDDADACPDSGSIRFVAETSEAGGIYGVSGICANVESSTPYHFGYKYKREANAGFGCQLIRYPDANCEGDVETLEVGVHIDEVSNADTVWRSTPAYSFTTGEETSSIKVYCQSDYNTSNFDYIAVLVDQVYLNAEAASY